MFDRSYNVFESLSRFWMPENAGGFADEVDVANGFILAVCYFFVPLIGGLMVWFCIKYRQTDKREVGEGATHSTPLEIGWTIPPVILVVAMFALGFTGYLDMSTPPPDTTDVYEIRAEAYQWGWNFYYPNGGVGQELWVPSDRPTKLTLESRDVIHSLFVPAMRAKKDVVPGRYNVMWFEPDESLVSEAEPYKHLVLHCTEYCGQNHAQMNTEVILTHPSVWEAKLAELDTWNREGLTPVALGREIYEGSGNCISCHSIDGSAGTGPSWKDVYGDPNHPIVGGQVVADANYIRESIRNPNAKYAAGYANGGMSAYPESQLNDGDIYAIIEFMKTISVHSNNAADLADFPEDYEGDDELDIEALSAGGETGGGRRGGDRPRGRA